MSVLATDDSGVRRIVFSTPAKLNALTVDDLVEATRLVTNCGPDIRGLLFTGSGRAFCAGMHLDSFVGLTQASAYELISLVRDFVGAVRTCPLPTVAMINGYCLGVAFELALACDFRVSVEDALFGLPEVKVGIPSVVDAALLSQYVGLSLAKEIILTGDLYPASSLAMMLNRIVPASSLEAVAMDMLGLVSRHSEAVVASQKRLFEVWQNSSLSDGIATSLSEFASMFEPRS
jgi:enoyl-CoA hydratase/carnithine racemase